MKKIDVIILMILCIVLQDGIVIMLMIGGEMRWLIPLIMREIKNEKFVKLVC